MASDLQEWLGRFEIDADNQTLSLDNGAQTPTIDLTAGSYFIHGHDTESPTTNQLVEHIQASMQDETGYSAANCTYSQSTGKITLDFAATTNVSFDDTSLRDLLGYTANLDSASTYTATNPPRYIWRPDRSFSFYPAQKDRIFEPESFTSVFRSRDGTISSVEGSILERADIEYTMLDDGVIFIEATESDFNTWERFFRDIVAVGEQIRLYPDRSVNTSTDYQPVIVSGGDGMIGAWSQYSGRHIDNFNGLWNISIPLLKFQ